MNRTKNLLFLLISMTSSMILSACLFDEKSSNIENDTSPPVIISTDPSDNASEIDLNIVITAVFNENMDQETVNNRTFFVRNEANALLDGQITCEGSVATFTPANSLKLLFKYQVTITV